MKSQITNYLHVCHFEKLHYPKILFLFWTFSFQPSSINTPLKPFNAKRSVKISYLITAFQRQPQPQEIDLREGGENLHMLKQSPTCQLSPLLCALKKYLTSYKGSKFITEGDVVSNSVCASLASSELVMPWAQWSLPCYTKSQSWTRLTPWHPWFLLSHAFPKLPFKNAVLVAKEMVSQQQLDCDRNVSL